MRLAIRLEGLGTSRDHQQEIEVPFLVTNREMNYPIIGYNVIQIIVKNGREKCRSGDPVLQNLVTAFPETSEENI